jgi:hypothetical protein
MLVTTRSRAISATRRSGPARSLASACVTLAEAEQRDRRDRPARAGQPGERGRAHDMQCDERLAVSEAVGQPPDVHAAREGHAACRGERDPDLARAEPDRARQEDRRDRQVEAGARPVDQARGDEPALRARHRRDRTR